jgi:hypothetical protein
MVGHLLLEKWKAHRQYLTDSITAINRYLLDALVRTGVFLLTRLEGKAAIYDYHNDDNCDKPNEWNWDAGSHVLATRSGYVVTRGLKSGVGPRLIEGVGCSRDCLRRGASFVSIRTTSKPSDEGNHNANAKGIEYDIAEMKEAEDCVVVCGYHFGPRVGKRLCLRFRTVKNLSTKAN